MICMHRLFARKDPHWYACSDASRLPEKGINFTILASPITEVPGGPLYTVDYDE